MKYSEIKDLQLAEIQKRLTQNKQNLFDACIKHKMQRQSNPLQLRFLKRDISRLQTVLSSLPASAFKNSSPKTVQPAGAQKPVVKTAKSTDVKKALKKTEKKPVKKEQSAAVDSSQEKQAKEKQAKEKVKPVEKKRWFGFIGSKVKQDKNLNAVSKKSFFRRKSG